jgi:CMP-N-acetylneuraminic acid synthetase/regulator of RNase E activity RraA
MKIVAIVPLKLDSSRIENKNIKLLCGKPLCVYTVEKLLSITEFDEVWIDTNSDIVVQCLQNYGVKGFKTLYRDNNLANNSVDGNKLFQNEIKNIPSDVYFQILCTSPFLKIQTIKNCIQSMKNGTPSLTCCSKSKLYLWENNCPSYNKLYIPNSQDINFTIYESMCLYAITFNEFNNTKCRLGNKPEICFIDSEETVDINEPADFDMAVKIQTFNHLQIVQKLKILKLTLNSCIILDTLKQNNFDYLFLPNFKTNINKNKLFGFIKPIQIRELNINEDPSNIYDCLNSYDDIFNEDVIFVNNNVHNKAYFGDLNATLAISKNAQGTIINGSTRDIDRTIDLNFPVFYKNNTADDVLGHGTLDFFSKPITIDNFTIFVNDIVFADTDGIVIFSYSILQQIIDLCLLKSKTENNVSQKIVQGLHIKQIIQEEKHF